MLWTGSGRVDSMVKDTYVRPAAFQAATIVTVFVVVRRVGLENDL